MKDFYDRMVWAVIALALAVIALNPWIAPGMLNAQSDVLKVDIVKYGGRKVSSINPMEVEIVSPVEISR